MINRINVTIGSSTIKKFVDLTLSQPFDNHHVFDIHLTSDDVNEVIGKNSGNQISLKELTQKWAGEKMTVSIIQGETDISGSLQQKTEQTFIAIITGVQLQMKDAVDNTVVISAISPTILFNTGSNTRCFIEKSLSDIVNEVFRPFKGLLKANISPSHSTIIPYITQFQEDNYHFLQRLAETYGEWFYYDGDEIIFGKTARNKTIVANLEYGSNLSQMEYDIRLVPLNFKGQYYDYFKDEKLETTSGGEKVVVPDYAQTAMSKSDNMFSYENLDISFQGHKEKSTLRQSVKFRKTESSNKLAVLKGTSSSLEVRIGSQIKVKDDIMENGKLLRTDDYGSFIITNIRHYVDSRGFYQNSFEAIPQDIDYPPVDYHVFTPRAESQPAKVIKTNDPEQMGRVKVQFYWQKDGETTPWIRVANAMSGQEQGVYFIPEIDEVVFVDFEFGNPDLPFVRGSMYHGNVKPGNNLFHEDNMIKGIITKGGNHIIIDDSDGKEEIRIYNKNNKNEVVLSMDGDPHIQVKSEGKIKLEGKEIELKAEKISMSASQEWTVETQQGSIESKSKMKIEGATVDIEGKSKTSVKGSSQLALEGGAQASLKAAMVMIN